MNDSTIDSLLVEHDDPCRDVGIERRTRWILDLVLPPSKRTPVAIEHAKALAAILFDDVVGGPA